MASNATRFMLILNNGIADAECNFYRKYGYTNALVLRSEGGGIGGHDDFHIIGAGSNYFYGDSTYDRAPHGSLGLAAAGASNRTLFVKFESSGKRASAWAPK